MPVNIRSDCLFRLVVSMESPVTLNPPLLKCAG